MSSPPSARTSARTEAPARRPWAADEDLHIAPVVGVLGFGVVTTVVLMIAMLRGQVSSFDVGLLGLGLIAMGTVGYFWASFNAGMSLADRFGIGGGDYAPWGGVLVRVSAAALVLLLAASAWRGLRAALRRR